MKQYQDLLRNIMEHGVDSDDRTGTGTRSLFGPQIRFDLSEGFPAVTTKKLAWNAVVGELLWFLEGSTDERRLAELTFGKSRLDLTDKRTIWTDNADSQGVKLGYKNDDYTKYLGPIYGKQWRNWNAAKVDHYGTFTVYNDQISNVIKSIKEDPYGRRHLVSAWNVGDIEDMALPPCHYSFQFYVRNGKLSCLWNQRSADAFLGVPFNIASYALLTHMIAKECGLGVGELIGNFGDAHIYKNHFDQVHEQLSREPYELPTLRIDHHWLQEALYAGYQIGDAELFVLENYKHHPPIKAKMAV